MTRDHLRPDPQNHPVQDKRNVYYLLGAWNRGVTREDGAAATAATVAAGGLGVQGCVRDTRRLVSAHRAYDTLSAGNVAS